MDYICENLKTSDNVKIACNCFRGGHDEVLIIAHGWFMSKNSKAFMQMSQDFCKYYDVITFDFRGHCDSSGLYTFGAEETKDLEAVVNFAAKKYSKIYLMGFSLGSLISINYCALNEKIKKLIVVSAPVNFKKIENNVLSPNAFIPTLKKFEFKRWISVRFKHPFAKKPEPINLVDKINIPIFFIAGEKDPIIRQWHNAELYEHANNPKSVLVFKNGKHAEDIYLENREIFVKNCVDWLNFEEQYVGV
ncbi:alpha/beta hydrolase [bacterium]|nr:alpha/beta hydrolase [bacterium]